VSNSAFTVVNLIGMFDVILLSINRKGKSSISAALDLVDTALHKCFCCFEYDMTVIIRVHKKLIG